MDEIARSMRTLEVSVKQAVKFPSTCTSETTLLLKKLLSANSASTNAHDEARKSAKSTRRPKQSTGHKVAKSVRAKTPAKYVPLKTSLGTEDGLSQKEKLVLATDVFNSASKALSDYVKLSSKCQESREPRKSRVDTPQKALTPRRPLQPVSPNSTTCSPVKTKVIDKSTPKTRIQSCGVVEVANCARLALSYVRDQRPPPSVETLQFNSQLEQGFCVLIGKLLAVGLIEPAISELRKLKRRIKGYMMNETSKGNPERATKHANTDQWDEPSKETLAELILFDSIPSDRQLLNLVISFQAHVLKAITTEKKVAIVNKLSDLLLLSQPSSPASIILTAWKKGVLENSKAAQQLLSLSHTVLSLSSPSPDTEDGKRHLAKPPIKYKATLNLQLLALEIRCVWWKICGHKCDMEKELWQPLARYLTTFSKRCPAITKSDFEFVKQAFLRLESTVTAQGYIFMPSANKVGPVSIVMKVLGQLAQSAECKPDALKFFDDCISSLTSDQPLLLGICHCKIALLRLEMLHIPKIGRPSKAVSAVSEALKCLASPLKGNQSDLEELVIESAKLKKAAMAFLNTLGEDALDENEGFSGQKTLALYIIDYLHNFVRFLTRYIGQAVPTHSDSGNDANCLFHQRFLKCKNIGLAAVDSVVAVGKISVVTKRPAWADIQPLLSDCYTLLQYLHSAESVESANDYTDLTSASFVKLSNLYWSRYVKQKELGASSADLITLLERSTSLLRTCPPENKAGFVAIKYERLATMYSDVSQFQNSQAAYRSAIQAHINSGVLKSTARNAATQPLSYILQDPTFFLGRVLSSYTRFYWKHGYDPCEAVFDDANLESDERGILLECQVMALLDTSSSGESHSRISPLSFLVSALLDRYPRKTYPIRRLRVVLHTIRFCLQVPTQFRPELLETILEEANLFLSDQLDIGEDSGLFLFKESMLTSLRLTLGFFHGELPPENLQVITHAWAATAQSCRTWESLLTKVDNPDALFSQLKVLVTYLEVLGLWKLRISALSTLRHLLEIQQTKDFPEMLSCLSHLGLQYSRLGYLDMAGPIFNCGEDLLRNIEIPPLVLASWNVALAEYLIAIGNTDQAIDALSCAKVIFEQNASCALNSSFQTRLAWERLISEAAYISSRIYFELGSVNCAMFFARCAVKLNNRIWAKLDRISEMKRCKTLDTSDSDIDDLSNKVNVISLTSDGGGTRDNYREGSLYWPLFTSHYIGLVNLSRLSAHNGLFQDCIYFGEQALKICKAIGATSSTFLTQAELGNSWLRGGHVNKGHELLDIASSASNSLDQNLDTVAFHMTFSLFHRLRGNLEERNKSLQLAHQTLLDISGYTTAEPTDDLALEPDFEVKMSQLTIKTTKQRQKASGSRKTKARCAKTLESPPANSRVPTGSTGETALQPLSFSQFRVDLLNQQIADLLSRQDFADASALLEQAERLPKCKTREMSYMITKAQFLLANWIQQLTTHAVYCVLPESTISLPTINLTNEVVEEKPSSTGSRSTKRLVPTTRTRAGASTTKSHTRARPKDFADTILTASSLLPTIASSAPVYGSTNDNHSISYISSQICMVSHATSSKLEGFSGPLQAAVSIVENGRNLAFLREHSSIAIDKELCGSVEPLKWPAVPNNFAKSDELRSAEFMLDYVDTLPNTWNVLSLTVSGDHKEFIISKLRSGRPPFLLRLPLKRGNLEEMDEDEFDFGEGKKELLEIIRLANESAHNARASIDKSAKKEWWATRQSLDNRLRDLLSNIETVWFGGFRGIFSQSPRNTPLLSRFIDSFGKILDKHLPSRRQRGRGRVHKTNFHRDVMELFVNIGNIDDCSDAEDLVMDLLYFVVDILQFHGERNAYDEIDFDMMVVETLDAIRCYKENEKRDRISTQSGHTILILDKELHSFPWESLSCLRGSSVSRMPSLHHLKVTLSSLQANNDLGERFDGFRIDRNLGSYILNPGGDLKSTQSTFENSLLSLDGWSGITNREPSEDEFKEYLGSKDLLLYFGHGSGAQYIRGRTIKRLDRCAVTFLMGCSSGSLTEAGEFEPYGTPINYMHAGAPALVATLWDVTDKDIDRFAQSTFEQWGLMDKAPVETNQASKSKGSKTMKPPLPRPMKPSQMGGLTRLQIGHGIGA
ncbi:separin [Histoplasma capsulatum G186AR]|uniref:separase n=1 Tax=Ajellomyces capsulatus (strain G186AR / H82 / ATCC MYA-2454 / RMSCC 2432) TaxID=447093 RepID=C0NBU5_AJECG|nr:separin [Histoplasma capsulatum G186AR]EEH11136.1 separin [Histoplasma capsulatum G186AR]